MMVYAQADMFLETIPHYRILLHKYPFHTDGSTGWCGPSNGPHEQRLNELTATCSNPSGVRTGVFIPHHHHHLDHHHVSTTSQGSNCQGTGQPFLPDLVCKEWEEADAPRGTAVHQSGGGQLVITLNTGTAPNKQASGDIQTARQVQTHPSDACPRPGVNYLSP